MSNKQKEKNKKEKSKEDLEGIFIDNLLNLLMRQVENDK